VNYYELNPEFNKQEELYILTLKKTQSKRNSEKADTCQSYLLHYQTLNPGKKLYKLNTGVTSLMKINESHSTKPKNYFYLNSPEPSQLEEETGSPLKENPLDDDGVPSNGFVLSDDPDFQNAKDISPIRLELYLQKNKSITTNQEQPYYFGGQSQQSLRINTDNNLQGSKVAESLIFTPTSFTPHQFGLDNNYVVDSPDNIAKLEQGGKFSFGNMSDMAQKKRNLNINLDHF